ncbi:MAG: phosphotransferase [Alphaproteobacteria bacterium]|nr:phosphotransferase [Alphaproteobacteria bacterium]
MVPPLASGGEYGTQRSDVCSGSLHMVLNGEHDGVIAFLRGAKLLGEDELCRIKALSGGVSCDVFAVEMTGRVICVKRALPKLRVAADWQASVRRSEAEAAWMRLAQSILPGCVPKVLAEDKAQHLIAMEYLPPDIFPVWKACLAAGETDPRFAAQVGEGIGRLHAATAGRSDLALDFANGEQFHALRLDAYLLHTAARHPDIGEIIRALAHGVAEARIALMHGDVSPKNILRGPRGPVFLDAETCCYGDPAFDLAFCLNHLLLKGVWHPEHAAGYQACFTVLMQAYFMQASWEPRAGLERRAARLLSAFLLARVDGKSPVEYITAETDKDFVRSTARRFLVTDAGSLAGLCDAWFAALAQK